MWVPLAAKEQEQQSPYLLRRQFSALFFMLVNMLSGRASYGSRTTCMGVFISAPNGKTPAHNL